MPSVYYAVCPGTGGTDDKKTGSPTITIASGVATLSVAQTGNIGQGFRITYDTSKVCFISKVNSSTSFNVVTATGGTPSNEASAVTVNSIRADYASLSAAEAGASDANHLNTSNLTTGSHILNLVCYAGASADTTKCTISGYTTSADYYINIYAPSGGTQSISNNGHNGEYDNDECYRLALNIDGYLLSLRDDYTRVKNIIASNQQNNANASCICCGISVDVSSLLIDSCILLVGPTGMGFNVIADNASSGIVQNTIIYAPGGSSGTTSEGVYINRSDAVWSLYNSTVSGFNDGVEVDAGTLTVTNCAVFNNGDDFDGSMTITYCASDDADGTNAVNISPGKTESDDWAAAFTDYANGDFSVKDTDSPLYDAGTDLSAYFTTDIAGTTRSTWDIGAFEFVSGPKWNTITPAKWNGVDWSNLKWNGM